MRILPALLMLAASSAQAAPPDNVSPLKSQFTTIDLAACDVLRRDGRASVWSCSGLPGYRVYIAETVSSSGSKVAMSFGPKADQQRAAAQTLDPSNSLYRDKRQRITVEWRHVRRNGRDLPYATIVRYFTKQGGARGQVLVVTRVGETEACRMALIDALANPSAIALARSIADELARSFDCKGEPATYGATGRSPM